jgi:hypothetical protein
MLPKRQRKLSFFHFQSAEIERDRERRHSLFNFHRAQRERTIFRVDEDEDYFQSGEREINKMMK